MPKTKQPEQARYENQRRKTVAASKRGKLNSGAVVELMQKDRKTNSLRDAVEAGIKEGSGRG